MDNSSMHIIIIYKKQEIKINKNKCVLLYKLTQKKGNLYNAKSHQN